MFFALAIKMALGSGLSVLSGDGSIYVFTTMGPWSDPVCREYETLIIETGDLLNGIQNHVVCLQGDSSAQAQAEARVEFRPDGFSTMVDGGGDALEGEVDGVFSRHDIYATMELAAEEDLRIRLDWSVLATGLSSVQIELQRLGDLDGDINPSPPIISNSASSYIEPVFIEGQDVLPISQGYWRLKLMTTHQAMGTKPGFQEGWTNSVHEATYVSVGDVDGNGVVDVQDVLILLDQFGACDGCLADLDRSGQVDVTDLLQLLAEWD